MQRDSVEAAVAEILASKPFAQSRRMQRFLRFVVDRTLEADSDSLKEYTIGLEVFDRSGDYDPRIDSIVRVEARRLRRKLKEFYETEGAGAAVRISLPEGSYVPVFGAQEAPPAPPVRFTVSPESPHHVVPADAYDQLILGRHFAAQMTPDGFRRSLACFQQAVRMDPEFAAAYAAATGSLMQMTLFGSASPQMVITDANVAVFRALTLNPNLPAAHLWRGFLKATHDWNWDEAEVDFERALELNPNFVLARAYYAATVMVPQGRFAEAQAHLRAAELLDPASVVLGTAQGLTAYYAGESGDAVKHFRRTLSLNPGFYGAHRLLAFAQLRAGDAAAARDTLQAALPLAGGDPRIPAAAGYVAARTGDAGQAREALAELDSLSQVSYVAAYDRAMIHLGLGEGDQAAALLMQACGEHEPWLIMLRVDPLFDPLRGRPELEEIARRVFPKEPKEE